MQLTGKIHSIGDVEQITEKFSKRTLILQVDPASKYPAYIPVEAINDKTDMFDGLKAGETVTLDVNLNGRLHVGKDGKERAYPSFVVYKIEEANSVAPQPSKAPSKGFDINDLPDDDDLPF